MNLFENSAVNVNDVTSSGSARKLGYGIFTISKIEAAEELTDGGLRRIDFFLETEDKTQTEKFAVFLSMEPQTSKNGDKAIYIDKFANFSIYVTEPETQENQRKEGFYTFFAEGARKAFVGEQKMMSLLNSVLNQTKKTKEGTFQNELMLSKDIIKGLYDADPETIKFVNGHFVGRKTAALIMKNSKNYTEVFEYFTKSYLDTDKIEAFFQKKVEKELSKEEKYSAIKDGTKYIVAPLGEYTDLKTRESGEQEIGIDTVATAEINTEDLPF